MLFGNLASHAARFEPLMGTPVVYIGAVDELVANDSVLADVTDASSEPISTGEVILSQFFIKPEPMNVMLLGIIIGWLKELHPLRNLWSIVLTLLGIASIWLNDAQFWRKSSCMSVKLLGRVSG